MLIYDSCPMFWDINEKCGLRKIRILYDGDVIAIITSTFLKDSNEWICNFTPMGFSFDEEKVKYLRYIINQCYDIFTFLKKPKLNNEEVRNFFILQSLY